MKEAAETVDLVSMTLEISMPSSGRLKMTLILLRMKVNQSHSNLIGKDAKCRARFLALTNKGHHNH